MPRASTSEAAFVPCLCSAGVHMCGRTLLVGGSAAQQAVWLGPPIFYRERLACTCLPHVPQPQPARTCAPRRTERRGPSRNQRVAIGEDFCSPLASRTILRPRNSCPLPLARLQSRPVRHPRRGASAPWQGRDCVRTRSPTAAVLHTRSRLGNIVSNDPNIGCWLGRVPPRVCAAQARVADAASARLWARRCLLGPRRATCSWPTRLASSALKHGIRGGPADRFSLEDSRGRAAGSAHTSWHPAPVRPQASCRRSKLQLARMTEFNTIPKLRLSSVAPGAPNGNVYASSRPYLQV
jgi:hypothetical protein